MRILEGMKTIPQASRNNDEEKPIVQNEETNVNNENFKSTSNSISKQPVICQNKNYEQSQPFVISRPNRTIEGSKSPPRNQNRVSENFSSSTSSQNDIDNIPLSSFDPLSPVDQGRVRTTTSSSSLQNLSFSSELLASSCNNLSSSTNALTSASVISNENRGVNPFLPSASSPSLLSSTGFVNQTNILPQLSSTENTQVRV